MTQQTPTNNTEVKIDNNQPAGGAGITVTIKTEKQLTEKEKVLKFLEQMADFLTIRHVALLSLLTMMLMVIWATYEQRHQIFASIIYNAAAVSPAPTWTLSEKSKARIQTLTLDEAIGAVMITDVILKRNVKIAKYYYVKDPALAKHFAALEVKFQGPAALFNKNQANTERTLSILNHEFACINTVDSSFASVPLLIQTFPKLCSLSIPAGPGEFAGYLTVALNKEISEEELGNIRHDVFNAVTEIHRRDISKGPEFTPKGTRR